MSEIEVALRGRRVLILVGEIYEDLELWYPKLRLQEAGAEVIVAGPEASRVYSGKHGYPCQSDVAITHMAEADFDALVVPGGFMPDKLRRDQAVLDLVQTEHDLFQSKRGISVKIDRSRDANLTDFGKAAALRKERHGERNEVSRKTVQNVAEACAGAKPGSAIRE